MDMFSTCKETIQYNESELRAKEYHGNVFWPSPEAVLVPSHTF